MSSFVCGLKPVTTRGSAIGLRFSWVKALLFAVFAT
jgi:hypothetical protein